MYLLFLNFIHIVPCLHTKCHANATCFNRPFESDCICNYGFSGDGIDHCDGKFFLFNQKTVFKKINKNRLS